MIFDDILFHRWQRHPESYSRILDDHAEVWNPNSGETVALTGTAFQIWLNVDTDLDLSQNIDGLVAFHALVRKGLLVPAKQRK